MRNPILSLFKRRPNAEQAVAEQGPVRLPATVRDAIDAAWLVARPADTDGNPRVAVTIPGVAPFIYSNESAAKVLARLFDDLSEPQLAKAVRYLDIRVTACAATRMINSASHKASEDRRPVGMWRDPWAPDPRPWKDR